MTIERIKAVIEDDDFVARQRDDYEPVGGWLPYMNEAYDD